MSVDIGPLRIQSTHLLELQSLRLLVGFFDVFASFFDIFACQLNHISLIAKLILGNA
jgi:hypothetical protein